MDKRIWINITFGTYCTLEGKEDFINDLKKEAVVQVRDVWHPACCTGTEVDIFKIFIDSPLADFLAGAIFSGIAWDGIKALGKKLFLAIEKFYARNEGIMMGRMEFEFNDISINIEGDAANSYAFLLNFFMNLQSHINYLNSQQVTDIRRISLPYRKVEEDEVVEGNYTILYDSEKLEDAIWKISYLSGCEVCYYLAKSNQIIE